MRLRNFFNSAEVTSRRPPGPCVVRWAVNKNIDWTRAENGGLAEAPHPYSLARFLAADFRIVRKLGHALRISHFPLPPPLLCFPTPLQSILFCFRFISFLCSSSLSFFFSSDIFFCSRTHFSLLLGNSNSWGVQPWSWCWSAPIHWGQRQCWPSIGILRGPWIRPHRSYDSTTNGRWCLSSKVS